MNHLSAWKFGLCSQFMLLAQTKLSYRLDGIYDCLWPRHFYDCFDSEKVVQRLIEESVG